MVSVSTAAPGGPRTVDVRRASDRFVTRAGWLDSSHSFSFGPHYDPSNTHFGLLLVSNDDVVAPGTGFDTHPHRDMEIVTWVLRGSLVHQDSTGHHGIVYPGLAQRMSAGTGILHSEKNDAWRPLHPHAAPDAAEPVHFVQMWVLPDEDGATPGYEQLDIAPADLSGGWATVASGMARHADRAAIRIGQRHAALHAARLRGGEAVALPTAPYVHLYVAAGAVDLEGPEGMRRLDTGDAVRVTRVEGERLVARSTGVASGPAEVLAWEMHAALTAGG